MKRARAVLVAILGIGVVVALIAGGVVLWSAYNKTPLPIEDRCTATAGGHTTTISPEQARNAAIIAGMSIKRGLAPRAASIALATAYQESGIRNLDHGHADSIGLFQQRPSKGWGTIEQIMDPWYSAREFYRTMERVKNWRTKDINDVAQAVQRSGYPDAYRQHETNARALASSLTGETPASFTCVVNRPSPGDPDGLATFLKKTLGSDTVTTSVKDDTLTVEAGNADPGLGRRAPGHRDHRRLRAGRRRRSGPHGWTHSTTSLAAWQGTGPTATAASVTLTFATATPR